MAEITIRISDKVLKAALVLAAIFLVCGFSYLWSLDVFSPKYQIRMFIPEVQGIGVDAPVRLAGMPIGRISRVELAKNLADSNRRIEIDLRIEEKFQNRIREDSYASPLRDGLLGERYIDIQPGFTGPPIPSGGEIRVVPVHEANFADFTNAIANAIAKKSSCENQGNNSPDAKSPATAKKPPAVP